MDQRKQLRELLRLVLDTAPDELDCDQFLERVGALLERLESGDQPTGELEAVSQHLSVCAECASEFEALRRALSQ